MKHAMMIFVGGMLGILTLAVILTIGSAMNRRNELQSSLSNAMEETVEWIAADTEYGDKDMMAVAACAEALAFAADTDSDITVEMYQADMQKGVLTMKVLENFCHPNGKKGTAEWQRTVIYNRREEDGPETYQVRFYQNREMMLGEENCYKMCEVLGGEHIMPPAEPKAEGMVFGGWIDTNGYMADFSQPIDQNLVYYASWE